MLVANPTSFGLQPMMINTKNPDPHAPLGTISSLLPTSSRAPPNASYSGLLECPCTDRKVKTRTPNTIREQGVCAAEGLIVSPAACFSAVKNLGLAPLASNITE